SAHQHTWIAEMCRERERRVEAFEIAAEILGQRAREGRQEDPGIRIPLSEVSGSMQQDNRLPRAGPTGESERTAAILLRVLALLGVQEHPPCSEIAPLDDTTQLIAVVDERELHLRGRMLER